MPCSIRISTLEEIVNLLNNLISKVLTQAHSNPAYTLGCRPPDDIIFILQAVKEELNDELKLFVLVLVKAVVFFVELLVLLLHLL